MHGLSWIKDFYALDRAVHVPTERTRYISLAVVAVIGLYAWMRYANGVPMLLAVILCICMFLEPFNKKFFKFVSVFLQIFFQTLRIVIMTFLYYTVFALSAIYFRRKQLENSSFLVKETGTLRKVDKLNINWKKMW